MREGAKYENRKRKKRLITDGREELIRGLVKGGLSTRKIAWRGHRARRSALLCSGSLQNPMRAMLTGIGKHCLAINIHQTRKDED